MPGVGGVRNETSTLQRFHKQLAQLWQTSCKFQTASDIKSVKNSTTFWTFLCVYAHLYFHAQWSQLCAGRKKSTRTQKIFGTYQKFFQQSDGAFDGLFRNSLDRAVREQEVGRAAQDNSDRHKRKFGKHKTKGHINRRVGVSQFGLVVRC